MSARSEGRFRREAMSCRPSDPLQRQVAELLVVRASGHLDDQQRRYPQWELSNSELQRHLKAGVGGVILLGQRAMELQQRTHQLQGWVIGPLLCADVEEGVGQRFEGASWLVPPSPWGDCIRTIQTRPSPWRSATATAPQTRPSYCGLNWVLGPVCDVNNNPANPVINVRAWGNTPQPPALWPLLFNGVCAAAACWLRKHFGPWRHLQRLPGPAGAAHSRERLEQLEFPFQ